MKIKRVSEYSDDLYDCVLKLLPQLDLKIQLPSKEFLKTILESDCNDFFIAVSENHEVCGMLTLSNYPNVSGHKYWIEDVVVDNSFRGQGIGEQLTRAGIEHARSMGAREIKLTSKPVRIAANNLYRKLGFELHETNVYKYKLESH